ncbi:1-hydroxycarotenoid 3,4-desaturase CrtD [Hyphomicrobium sp.]|uniref:1-hydroxycarotenoid 3,4-desaturase CrtD n=1 Tax=Hyphomicrobium sp. TaxID=82 RepID=UPI000FA6A484|nr:1-hydroxycarotenoid 3,4-desaturase CrtD [Hyphomicrobium sp.]RUP00583.1 MAG: phytoene desaturase [Hyphomicrobium sp.]
MNSGSRAVIIGAGIGGLVAAIDLAIEGFDVTVLERSGKVGGKMGTVAIGADILDAGPTVFTMRWVFDSIFERAGASLESYVSLAPVDVLARHAWNERSYLDLYADMARSSDAIGDLFGAADARGYLQFCKRAQETYETLRDSYILSAKPTPLSLAAGAGLKGFGALWRISPFTTLWNALGEYFQDQRLRQLFGRYATYCGSSPFEAPATLMLISHVEREGVWLIDGGMHRLAEALMALAQRHSVTFRFGADVRQITVRGGRASGVTLASGEHIEADVVVTNGDVAALTQGLLGPEAKNSIKTSPGERSLSAVTWAMSAKASGFPLKRHNVFFSSDYRAEFDQIFSKRQLPAQPTVYVCAQDRDGTFEAQGSERIFALVNAPAIGDVHPFDELEIQSCAKSVFELLRKCGLELDVEPNRTVITTPNEFAQRFPATGGSLYGRASHGWAASFARPTAKTLLKGLYVAGGSAHPGAGVPMAAISGQLAAAQIVSDTRLTRRFHPTVMPGGTSTR